MTVPQKKAPANYVPAAAVKRRGRALSGITGRKGRVGGLCSQVVKTRGLTSGWPLKPTGLRTGEGSGISGVAVKCVDTGRNTSGEGGSLDWS